MGREEFKSIGETISDIARRKSDAARARREGRNETAEPSAQVYAESCSRIATAFVNDGFRYAKSGPHMTRRRNGFTEKVSFQTSYHNIPGKHVELSVAATVRSKNLKEWRGSQPASLRKGNWVGGGMIHLLGIESSYLKWELADPEGRDDTVADVIDTIRSLALPYFDVFQDLSTFIRLLIQRDVPAMDIGDAVEFALCFGSRDQAQAILERFVTERPDLAGAIAQAEAKMNRDGLPAHVLNAYADQVAFLRIYHGMK
jgi:hypothetical protein